MNDETLLRHLNSLLNGTIGEDEHRNLQDRLKSDPAARSLYRELMDVEASLRTLAAEEVVISPASAKKEQSLRKRRSAYWMWGVALTTLAASALAVLSLWPAKTPNDLGKALANTDTQEEVQNRPAVQLVGRIVQQSNCRWDSWPDIESGRFTTGSMKLLAGAAELRFDSGTNVVLESPCEIEVASLDSARLIAGTVFVDVTEVSSGFLLETPESQIVDEGTQYAVSLDTDATEVHVFDGSVVWTPTSRDNYEAQRIAAGEARRYLRTQPQRSNRIPFGQRQFVRKIEADVLSGSGGELLAYDGFENLAGQLRRGRSGFGWSGGWQLAGRGRGPLAEVIDAPDDSVFGNSRTGRRLLLVRDGDELRRDFEHPISLGSERALFISLLVSRQAKEADDGASLQIAFEPESNSPRYTRRHSVTFGITSSGSSFVNNAGTIDETATNFVEGATYLVVLKYEFTSSNVTSCLRIFPPEAEINTDQPLVWTATSTAATGPQEFSALRITSGPNSTWQLDELKIGTTWPSVATPYTGSPQTPPRSPKPDATPASHR